MLCFYVKCLSVVNVSLYVFIKDEKIAGPSMRATTNWTTFYAGT